jgi:Tol biopolymer transport system component
VEHEGFPTPYLIETLPRLGYRFIGTMTESRSAPPLAVPLAPTPHLSQPLVDANTGTDTSNASKRTRRIAFSHNGRDLAYGCMHSSGEYAIYTIPAAGGSPRLIVTYPNFAERIAWTADDKRILLSEEAPNIDELEEVVVATGGLRRIPFGQDGSWPAISPKGERLAYSLSSDNINIWRKDLTLPNLPPSN